MPTYINKYSVALFLLILSITQITACRSGNIEGNQDSPHPYINWFSNPKDYHTNIMADAQAETPFTIVLPTYLPEDINPFPDIGGRAKSEFDNREPITITYTRGRSGYLPISIEEYNMTIMSPPAIDGESEYLTYFDIQVLEKKTDAISFDSDSNVVIVPEFDYTWNKSRNTRV